jgi:PmbA protein
MSELLAQAHKILERVEGSEHIEVFLSSGSDTEIEAYQGKIEKFSSATSAGVGIRILQESEGGARIGTAWAGSLDEDAVATALREARDNARYASLDEYVTFARPDGVAAVELQLSDPAVASTPLDEKIAMAIDLEKAVRSADPRIRQVDSAGYTDYISEAALASTFGVSASYARTGAYLSVVAIATDGSSDQTGWGSSVGRSPRDLDGDVATRDAVRRATRMLGAVKPTSMKTTAVFDPRTSATLLAIIGSALSGEAVVRGRSFFAERLGEVVAAQCVSLVDDPTDVRHFAASPFDGEGLACRRNVLIENGQLRGFVYDTVSARRAGTRSTGSALRGGIAGSPSAGCRALQLASGAQTQEEIFRALGDGIFVESLTGVHSGVNPISGDFSVGITGLMIRNGEIAEPIREVTVASTLQRMLQDVVMVGNDVEWLPGSAAGQSLAIAGISVSGS